MGARIASCYAAKYPNDICTLIMEDMDIRKRNVWMNPVPMNETNVIGFQKRYPTLDDLRKSLLHCGYPNEMIDKWIHDGRIRHIIDQDNYHHDHDHHEQNSYYWTDVNPEMRLLAYKHIMSTNDGEQAWYNIAANSNHSFHCHLMVAGMKSQCNEQNLKTMNHIMKDRMIIHRFPHATHCIHKTQHQLYMKIIQQIISDHTTTRTF